MMSFKAKWEAIRLLPPWAILLVPGITFGQTLPSMLREGLASEFHFTANDFTKIERGIPVAHG